MSENENVRIDFITPYTVGANVVPLTVGEGVAPLTVGNPVDIYRLNRPLTFEEVISSDDMPHAECGGSSSNIWVNCPPSIILGRGVAHAPASDAAKKGTFQHKVNEVVMEDWLLHRETGSDPEHRARVLFQDFEDELEIAFTYRDVMWEKVFKGSVTNKFWDLEELVTLHEAAGSFGSIDLRCLYVDDRGKLVVHINDYKNGYGHVPAESMQLLYYLGAFHRELLKLGKQADVFIGSIYQPHDGHEDTYREKRYTRKQIETFLKKADKSIDAIYGENKKPRYKLGDWCKYCKGKIKCGKYQKDLEGSSTLNLLKAPISYDQEKKIPIEGWTEEQILKVVQNEDAIKEILKACKSHILGKCLEGGPYLGMKAVHSSTRKMWASPASTLDKLVNELKIPEAEVANTKIKSISDVTKVLKRYSDKATAEAFLETEVGKTSPSPQLVPETDKRPAITTVVGLLGPVEDEGN